MASRRKNREIETFSMSFLDVICCGFGAVILLLVISKIYEPVTIEKSRVQLEALLLALQQEVFDVRGETTRLDRELNSLEAQQYTEDELLAGMRAELQRLQGQYEPVGDEDDLELKGELLAARQSLNEEMRRLLRNYKQSEDDTTVGGIPVDSEYIIFVIDTSGSMFQGPWRLVLQMVSETLQVYPQIKGIQVLNDEGRYMFSSYAGRWIPDSPSARRNILKRLAGWNPYSDSSPVEGITEAISTFYAPDRPISIFVFGDDFPRGSVDAVVRYVDQVNTGNAEGKSLVRIHAVGFPTQFGRGTSPNALRFANLMRALCERNGGSYVGLTRL
jgi:hypothetical protein